MSNSYFNFTTGRMVAGENALAEDVNSGFDAVAAGFDKLPTPDATKFLAGAHETTSGSAGNFVLAVTADSYFDGMAVSFKANHSNSGACTLNVGSLGAKSLVDGNGAVLAVGDIVANSIYAARYNSTSDKFHLVGLSSGNAADAAVVAANIVDVATIAENIDELLLVDDNATAAAGSASDASGYADDALTQAGLASDYAVAAAASAANLPNATTAGADKILTTNSTGDGWSYISKYALNGKNLLINGGFDVWQRGTSFADSLEMYTADRWLKVVTSSTFLVDYTCIHGQEEGLTNCIKLRPFSCQDAILLQRVEGLQRFSNKTVTLSFWAKSDDPEYMSVEFVANFGTGGTPSTTIQAIGVTKVATTASWAKYTITAELPSMLASTFGTNNDSSLDVNFWYSASPVLDLRTGVLGQQNGVFYLSNVQLEFGDTATDFEYRHPAEELMMCQRYYETGTLRGPFAQYNPAYAVGPYCQFLVEKRKVPVITLGPLAPAGHDGTPGSFYGDNAALRGFNPVYNWTGGTIGRSFFGQLTWTADAEL